MDVFKNYEKEVVLALLNGNNLSSLNDIVLNKSEYVDLEYSGVGYFLTVKNETLPTERMVLEKPLVIGTIESKQVGFLAFLESNEFTLECYSYDYDEEIKDNSFREKSLEISAT